MKPEFNNFCPECGGMFDIGDWEYMDKFGHAFLCHKCFHEKYEIVNWEYREKEKEEFKYLPSNKLISKALKILYYLEDNRTDYTNEELGRIINNLQKIDIKDDFVLLSKE